MTHDLIVVSDLHLGRARLGFGELGLGEVELELRRVVQHCAGR